MIFRALKLEIERPAVVLESETGDFHALQAQYFTRHILVAYGFLLPPVDNNLKWE